MSAREIDMGTMRQACVQLEHARRSGDIGGNAYNAASSTILAQANRPLPSHSMRGIYVLPNGGNCGNELRTIDSWVYHLTRPTP
jgi:hypothetical protein